MPTYTDSVKLIPIFDTSTIRNLSDLSDSDPILRRLTSCIPTRGCPLSHATVLELFHGLFNCSKDRIDDALKPIFLAARLSRRHVLPLPLRFIEREVFQIRASYRDPSSADLKRWLGITQRPGFSTRFASGSDEGLNVEKVETLFETIREGHQSAMALFCDDIYPQWRVHRDTFRTAFPEDLRQKIKQAAVDYETWRAKAGLHFLKALEIEINDDNLRRVERCDAYLSFLFSLFWDSSVGNYHFDKNPNDFHDGLQLLYLSHPLYCVVTEDKKWKVRASKSRQCDRIVSLDEFLSRAA
jgi:hypothetical protein